MSENYKCEVHFRVKTGGFCPVCLINERDRLRTQLDQIERQVIVRTEDMPVSWAAAWYKDANGDAVFVSHRGWYEVPAPDYRPEEFGPLWLPIIDAPDAGKGD